MPKAKVKAILDFDGTLTDEVKQAEEIVIIAKSMLAKILELSVAQVEQLYQETKQMILKKPEKYFWEVNGLPATYAYEGAYLLNTGILQTILRSRPQFISLVSKKFPSGTLDSVTLCTNYMFHEGSFHVSPHFLPGVREFLIHLIENDQITPVILTNSETRKIAKNLLELEIGEKGTSHPFPHEIEILGDTRQYHMDSSWNEAFAATKVLPINKRFSVDLRRPIYHRALKQVQSEGYKQVVIAADGFSLAGALPLVMDMNFILMKTSYTPKWSERYVRSHPKGKIATNIFELESLLHSFVI